MLPIVVDIAMRKVLVVGRGAPAQQRLEYVQNAGAERIFLYAIDQDGWACYAQAALYERLPVESEFQGAVVTFIAGMPRGEAVKLAAMARAAGSLVNVEDVPELCDFHLPAILRRGDLSISISTNGKAPSLAQKLKSHLQESFGPEWSGYVARIAEARARWRDQGISKGELSRLTSQMVEREDWLKERALS